MNTNNDTALTEAIVRLAKAPQAPHCRDPRYMHVASKRFEGKLTDLFDWLIADDVFFAAVERPHDSKEFAQALKRCTQPCHAAGAVVTIRGNRVAVHEQI